MKYLKMFKKLQMNILFIEAIAHMPYYAKFLKEFVSNKKKLEEYATVALTKECNAVLQNKQSPKLKDTGSFTIPCSIRNVDIKKSLCDLEASVNLMPFSIFNKLGIGELMPTTVSLQLVDHSIKYPLGVVENVLVKFDKFYFPVDFYVLEMDNAIELPIILGSPFLATGRALIDVNMGKLTFGVGAKIQDFNVFSNLKMPTLDRVLLHVVHKPHTTFFR